MIESTTAVNSADDETPSIYFPDSRLDLPRDHSFHLGGQTFQENEILEGHLCIDRTTLPSSEAIANGLNRSLLPSGNSGSELEGNYVDIADISLPRFGPQVGSLTQSMALNYQSLHRSREKQRLVFIRDSRTYSKNVVSTEMSSIDGQTEASRDYSSVPSKNIQYLDCSESVENNRCVQQMQIELKDSDYITHSEFVCQTALLAGNADYCSFAEQWNPQQEDTGSNHYSHTGVQRSGESQAVNLAETPIEMEQEKQQSEARSECPAHSTEAGAGNSARSRTMGGHEQSESDPWMSDSPVTDVPSLTATEHSRARCIQPAEGWAVSCAVPMQASDHTFDEISFTEQGPACTDRASCLRSQKALDPNSEQHCRPYPPVEVGPTSRMSAEMPLDHVLSQAGLRSVEESVKHLERLVELQNAVGAENNIVKTDAGKLPEGLNLAGEAEVSPESAECAGSTSAYLSKSNNQFIHTKDADVKELETAGVMYTHQAKQHPDDFCAAEDTVSAVIRTLSPDNGFRALPQAGGMGAASEEPEHRVGVQIGNITPVQSKAELVHIPTRGAELECSTRRAVRGAGEHQGGHVKGEAQCMNIEAGPPASETPDWSEPSVFSVDTTPLHSTTVERTEQEPTPESAKDARLIPESPHSTDSRDARSTAEAISRDSLLQVHRVCDREEPAVAKRPEPLPFPPATRRLQTPPTQAKDVNLEVLSSGVVCLPGTHDRSGHAVVIVSTRNTVWLNPHCNTSELFRLFLYFYSIPRLESQALGLTVLVDARRCSPVPALFRAFNKLQEAVPNCIHGVLLLGERDLTFRVEKPTAMQFELLTSVKSLHKHIESAQLPLELDGSFPYCHRDWLNFRLRLEHLQQGCSDAFMFLQSAMEPLESAALPDKAQEAGKLLDKYGQLMNNVLDDTRLVKLQLEGGAMLARLKKEESRVTLTDDYRDAVEAVAALYNQVDEGVHRLVMLSNRRIQELEVVIEFEAFEADFQEVSCWIEQVGEKRLKEKQALEDSLEVLLQAQQAFRAFDRVACEYCRRGQEAMKKMERWEEISFAELLTYQVKLKTYKRQLGEFSKRLDESRSRIDRTVTLYQFFDKAYKWALVGMRHLACFSMEDCISPESSGAVIQCLEGYREQHPEISEDSFLEMKELACELSSDGGAKQWKFAWSKCQETKRVFEKKLEAALRTRRLCLSDQPAGSGEKAPTPCGPGLAQRRYSEGMEPRLHFERNNSVPYFHHKQIHSPAWRRDKCLSQSPSRHGEPEHAGQDSTFTTGASTSPFSSGTSLSSLASVARRQSLSSISDEEPNPEGCRGEVLPSKPSCSSTPTSHRPFQKRTLRKAQSFDLPDCESTRYGCQRTLSEPARRGNTGVFIKGLEVNSTEVVDRAGTPRQQMIHDWSAEYLPKMHRGSSSSLETKTCGSKLRHIIDEMVTTEREYVRSLWYIIGNYFPEMERFDLPQDLRGKRSVLFGNLEKLYDFHSQYFLKELESCCNHPLRVSHCFLRHQDQFGMYALYSKNKPKSDSLLASHGNSFFKVKQMQLGDKMDLASYLLKPIQRMSKYALLLKDLIKECSEAQEQELCYLRAAEEMVKFQLRHGNDLLAMDAIRDCDVNLKEQGQLVRQDEFTIWLGRKKCQRHVFLFEDLILFSKPKRMEGGLDVYIYKRSFKTADIGLTENSGESGLRFEIWFRRRKSNDTYVLQAGTSETKQAWTSDVAQILWQQATRNKEIRMQEMVSMGVGNKPFMDIKPSDAAINDRAIDYIMKGRGARTRASIAVSLFDHSNPYKRTQMPISTSNTPSICAPSSASLLGPLNLHVYVNQGVMASSRPFSVSTCIEEDELEHDTSSQPSMTTESSESSQCMSGSGSSGSDSGCVSSVPQESLSEDACSPCDTAASYAPLGPRQHSSIPSPPPGDKPRFMNRQYISANTGQIIISPSTVV